MAAKIIKNKYVQNACKMHALLIFLFLMFAVVDAHEVTSDKPRTTPDKLFYGTSVALDKLSLALTFDKYAKAQKGLAIAHERLLEIRAMREAGKLDKAQRSADEYAAAMGTVAAAIETAPEANPEKDAAEIGDDDSRLTEVTEEGNDVSNELDSDAVAGNLTDVQKTRIEKINEQIAKHQNAIARLEERKLKLEKKLFGEKLKAIEEEHANQTARAAKAQGEITKAGQAIATATPLAANLPQGERFLANANEHLTRAKTALADKKYGEAFGQANAAFHIAKAIEKRSEQLGKREEKKEEMGNRTLKQWEVPPEKIKHTNHSSEDESGYPAQKVRKASEQKQEQRSSGGY